jgi:hypothetical protein
MFAFTIIGFVIEGGKYLDFQMDVSADTPVEAIEKAKREEGRAVISTVLRNQSGGSDGF